MKQALALLAALVLAGCGFHPLYAKHGSSAPAVAGMAQVDIARIPERFGQLTREALEERLTPDGPGTVQRYRLSTALGLSSDAGAIERNTVATHVRLIGTATWTLTAEDAGTTTLAHGTARDIDGFDVIDQQYFNADLDNSAAQRRIAHALADQIALQLAIYFEHHPPPP